MDVGRAGQNRPPAQSGLRRSGMIWALAVLLAACRSSALPASLTPEAVGSASLTGSATPSTLVSPTGAESAATRYQQPIPYRRVLEPSLTSSSSSWSNASGPQPVASDAIAASSASFDG